jgi:hypothetical protein
MCIINEGTVRLGGCVLKAKLKLRLIKRNRCRDWYLHIRYAG